MQLDLAGDLHDLFRDIVDIRSESLHEDQLADTVEESLRGCDHLTVTRIGNSIVAATNLGRDSRVLVAGHLDTVPVADNLPSHVETRDDGDYLVGRGTCDMKGGVAVALHLAATLAAPSRDVTWVFYEAEEIAAEHNGLLKVRSHEESLLDCDLAILMEPTDAIIEGGCQGTMRFTLTTEGQAAHSARSWAGHNAIHDLLPILQILQDWQADGDHLVEVDGLTYHEGLNATMVQGGLAGNVVPPTATVQINYRFAPDKTAQQAEQMMRTMFADWTMEILDLSSPARPGLDKPLARSFARCRNTAGRMWLGSSRWDVQPSISGLATRSMPTRPMSVASCPASTIAPERWSRGFVSVRKEITDGVGVVWACHCHHRTGGAGSFWQVWAGAGGRR